MLSEARYAASKPNYDMALAGKPLRFERTDEDHDGLPRHSIVSYLPDTDERGGFLFLKIRAHGIAHCV